MRVRLVVLALYGAWLLAYLGPGNDVRDFVGFGTRFLDRGNFTQAVAHPDEPRIRLDGYVASRSGGYDGQFSFYIAALPRRARGYLDIPSLRYTRIVQPMLARALSHGDQEVLPFVLVLINWMSAGAGTLLLAVWLSRRGASPWLALLYGLFPGMLVALQRDTAEPLAYALVLAGLVLLDRPGRGRLVGAGLVFGLSGLTKQTTLVFPLVLALWMILGGQCPGQQSPAWGSRWKRPLLLASLSLLPYLGYSLFLRLWLGSLDDGGDVALVPFQGLVHPPWRLGHQGLAIALVILPTLVALIVLLPRRPLRSYAWLSWTWLLVNFLGAVVFFGRLYTNTYPSHSRIAIGIVLAAVLCAPYAQRLSQRRRTLLVGLAALSLAMTSVVAVRGYVSLTG